MKLLVTLGTHAEQILEPFLADSLICNVVYVHDRPFAASLANTLSAADHSRSEKSPWLAPKVSGIVNHDVSLYHKNTRSCNPRNTSIN